MNAGLHRARGSYFAVMAADLQEPPDLMIKFYELLASGSADIAIGCPRQSIGSVVFAILQQCFLGALSSLCRQGYTTRRRGRLRRDP